MSGRGRARTRWPVRDTQLTTATADVRTSATPPTSAARAREPDGDDPLRAAGRRVGPRVLTGHHRLPNCGVHGRYHVARVRAGPAVRRLLVHGYHGHDHELLLALR